MELLECHYNAPCGRLVIWSYGNEIVLCDWEQSCGKKKTRILNTLHKQVVQSVSEEADKLSNQLGEYFSGKRRVFDIKHNLIGTEFQKHVWQSLMCIPYGHTISYSEESAMAGKPNAVRAVGAANGANPICIVVPCHRVIGKDGHMTGYAGGVDIKEYLLRLEKGTWRYDV